MTSGRPADVRRDPPAGLFLFPPDEIRSRWSAAQRALQQRGLAGMMVTGKHNYWYLTGHRIQDFESNTRPAVLLLPARGEPAAVLYQQRAPAARAAGIGTVHAYEDAPLPVPLLLRAMRDSGLDGGAVGCELGSEQRLGLPLRDFDALREGLPRVAWVDAAGLLWGLRLHKSPAELDLLQRAADVTLAAWRACHPSWSGRTTAQEMAVDLAVAMLRHGSDLAVAPHISVSAGASGAVSCDYGGAFGGYIADLSRRAVPASLRTAEAERTHAACHAILEAMIARIGPGVRCSEVARAASDGLVRAGFPPLGPHKRVGHGLGQSGSEPPSLSLADDTPLEPGMVLTPEPSFRLPDGERVHLEEMVAVTATGRRRLSAGAGELGTLAG